MYQINAYFACSFTDIQYNLHENCSDTSTTLNSFARQNVTVYPESLNVTNHLPKSENEQIRRQRYQFSKRKLVVVSSGNADNNPRRLQRYSRSWDIMASLDFMCGDLEPPTWIYSKIRNFLRKKLCTENELAKASPVSEP